LNEESGITLEINGGEWILTKQTKDIKEIMKKFPLKVDYKCIRMKEIKGNFENKDLIYSLE